MNRTLSRLWWRRYISRGALPWEILDRFPAFSPGEQKLELARRLHAQIRYFGAREDALPEWREAARIEDPLELWKLWPSLPVVTRDVLRSRFEPAEIQRRFHLEGRVDSTGGSTGEPTRFFFDRKMILASNSADIYSRLKMGWRPGMPTIFVWGAERDIGKSVPWRIRLHHALVNEFPVAGYNLTSQTVERVVQLIRKRRPVALYGFTSMLDYVARGVLDACGPVDGVVTAWNGGEMLFDDQRERFHRAFGIPLRNRYGGRELACIAAEYEPGGPLAILRPWVFLEIVDDQGKPVPTGESGRILCTSTVCRGTPFLRYEVGDTGAADVRSTTESGIAALARLEGRVSGIMLLPDGRRINALFWNHFFKDFSEVVQFQVVIVAESRLELLLQGAGMSPQRSADLTARLRNFLGNTPFAIRWVDSIPRTARGKLVQVVRSPS